MNKCPKCQKNCEGEYCFRHKSRAPLKRSKIPSKTKVSKDNVEKSQQMKDFFLEIWKERYPHNCENCNKWLGTSPRTYMFDHLLEKSKYPELKYEKENIMLVCFECHDKKTRGFYSKFIENRIKTVREKFGK